MSTTTAKQTSLFISSYSIGTGAPGAPTLKAELSVNTVHETVTGIGTLTQAVNPPEELRSYLQGDYSYMTVMGQPTRIQVRLTGTPSSKKSPSKDAFQTEENIEVVMVLDEGWKSGTANYKYRDARGAVKEVKDVPVKQLHP